MPWFVRGDIDGFFGLALDNLIQLLLINYLCRSKQVLGFPEWIVEGRILPGAAVSLLVGNLFYAWQAKRLADRTGRLRVILSANFTVSDFVQDARALLNS